MSHQSSPERRTELLKTPWQMLPLYGLILDNSWEAQSRFPANPMAQLLLGAEKEQVSESLGQ
jgi:hypothetical protein